LGNNATANYWPVSVTGLHYFSELTAPPEFFGRTSAKPLPPTSFGGASPLASCNSREDLISCYRKRMPGNSATWRCWSRLRVAPSVRCCPRHCCRRFHHRGNEPCSRSRRAERSSTSLLPSRSQGWTASRNSIFRRQWWQWWRKPGARPGCHRHRHKSLRCRGHCRWRNRRKTRGWRRLLWWWRCRARLALALTRCNRQKTRCWNPPGK